MECCFIAELYPRPFQLWPQQRQHCVDLLLKSFWRAFLLLRLLIDNGFLQLKERPVGLLQFQPTETREFRGHGVGLHRRLRKHKKKTTINVWTCMVPRPRVIRWRWDDGNIYAQLYNIPETPSLKELILQWTYSVLRLCKNPSHV